MRVLALGGIAGPLVFTLLIVICGARRPDYDHFNQFISELGETGAPDAALMNLAGFIPAGLLNAALGLALSRVGRGPRALAAAILIVVFGLGMAAAGVFSCDPGCHQQGVSTEATLHHMVSGIAFISAIVGIGLSATVYRRLPAWQDLWRFSAFTSAVAFLLLVVMNASIDSRALTGFWQRLFLATLFVWCGVVGWRSWGQVHQVR
jgi:hypothetical membrane protein